MAIQLATKYSKKIVDKFYTDSVILGKTSKEYDWDGVKSIKVWTINTYPTVAYGRPGSVNADDETKYDITNPVRAINAPFSRYGATNEVEDTVQVMTLTQDRAVSLSVDKGNNTEQMLIKNAGVVMARELREQFIPEFDKYCLLAWKENGTNYATLVTDAGAPAMGAWDKEHIVENISNHVTALMNAQTDVSDAYCYIGATQFANLILSDEFLNIDKLGARNLEKGVLGTVRGLQIVPVPDSYMPSGVHILTAKKSCVLAPTQIKDAKVHQDPPGLSGALLEIRWLYDAFVLDTKKAGVIFA